MLKRLISQRVLNIILVFLSLAIVFGSIYFYLAAKTNITTINTGIEIAKDFFVIQNFLSAITTAATNLMGIVILQLICFLILALALVFLLGFVCKLYFIEKMNALIDPLTQLYNRRAIFYGLKHEIERAKRFKHSISIAIVDVDYFKQYNDSNGHSAGDKALKKIASLFKQNLREIDMVGRIGGEEFLIIFPEIASAKTIAICERLRKKILEHNFFGEEKLPTRKLTISVGISSLTKNHEFLKEETFVEHADKNLYRAKFMGRNRIVSN